MTPSGIRQMIWRRSDEASVPRTHPHSLRHYSDQFLKAGGGQESDLMALNGWSSVRDGAPVRGFEQGLRGSGRSQALLPR